MSIGYKWSPLKQRKEWLKGKQEVPLIDWIEDKWSTKKQKFDLGNRRENAEMIELAKIRCFFIG